MDSLCSFRACIASILRHLRVQALAGIVLWIVAGICLLLTFRLVPSLCKSIMSTSAGLSD